MQSSYTDPYVDEIRINKSIMTSVNVKNFNDYDLTILCTDHYNFNYKRRKRVKIDYKREKNLKI